MNILSLNTWYGKRFDELREFVISRSKETDVFCLQEMLFGGPREYVAGGKARGSLYEELAAVLPEFQALHAVSPSTSSFIEELRSVDAQGNGLAIFIRKTITILESGSLSLYDGDPFALTASRAGAGTGLMLWAHVQDAQGKRYTIATLHGLFLDLRLPSPAKRDTPERIEQSRRIVDFIKKQQYPCIVVGDLNLRPETQSIAMLSEVMRNLISEYGITNTRNYEYELMEEFKDYIADYAFVSKEITLREFKVLPDVVSDHAPLMLEF